MTPPSGARCDDAAMTGERDLPTLLAALDPVIAHSEVVVVEQSGRPSRPLGPGVLAMVCEDGATTLVMPPAEADRRGLAYDCVFSWITLRVHSSLEAVGLTAAVSGALARSGIACNVLAGARHDHLLVPLERAADAMRVLRDRR